MTIHLELEYTKRFGQGDAQRKSETSQGGGGETGTDEDASGGTSSSMSPLPPKEDISWGHILAHNQVPGVASRLPVIIWHYGH